MFGLAAFLYVTIIFVLMLVVIVMPADNSLLRCIYSHSRRWLIISMLVLFVAALSIIAYKIGPKYANDLYRHYYLIDRLRSGSIILGSDIAGQSSPLVLTTLLFRFVSILPSNHYLQVVSVVVTYGVLLLFAAFYSRRYHTNIKKLAIYFFVNFSMVLFASVISGVRNTMAFAIFSLVFYMDIFQLLSKNNFQRLFKWVLYLVPVLIHPSVIILIFIRLAAYLVRKWQNLPYLFLLSYPLIFLGSIALSFINLPLAQYLAVKSREYLPGGEISFILGDWRLYVVRVALVTVVLALMVKIRKYVYNNYDKIRIDYFNLFFIIVILTVGNFISFVLFDRMFIALAFLSLPIIDMFYARILQNKYKWAIAVLLAMFFATMVYYNIVSVVGNMDVSKVFT